MDGDLHKFNEFSAVGPWNIPTWILPAKPDEGSVEKVVGQVTNDRVQPVPAAQHQGITSYWDLEKDQFEQTITEYLRQVMAHLHPVPTAEEEAIVMERAAHFGEWTAIKAGTLLNLAKWVRG